MASFKEIHKINLKAGNSAPRLYVGVKPIPQIFTQFTFPDLMVVASMISLSYNGYNKNYGVNIFIRMNEVLKYIPELQIAKVTKYNQNTNRQIGKKENEVYFPVQLGSAGMQYRLWRSDLCSNCNIISAPKFNSLDELIAYYPPEYFWEEFVLKNNGVSSDRLKNLLATDPIAKREIQRNMMVVYFSQTGYTGWSPQSIFCTLTDGNYYKYSDYTARFFALKNKTLYFRYFNNQYWTGNASNTACGSWTLSKNDEPHIQMPVIDTKFPKENTPIPYEQQFVLVGKLDSNHNSEYVRLALDNPEHIDTIATPLNFTGSVNVNEATKDTAMVNLRQTNQALDKITQPELRKWIWL